MLHTIVKEQPGTILQGGLSYGKGPIPAQTNIPNYTFQDVDSQSYMNMFNSSNTCKEAGGNINNENI